MSRKSPKEPEIWRSLKGRFTGWPYEVSSRGRVRRVGRGAGCRPNRIRKLRPSRAGYWSVTLRAFGVLTATIHVHKLVAEAFIGPCPYGMEVNHKDTNKLNSKFSNLEYVTRKRNCQHASENGLLGPKNPELCGLKNIKVDREKIETIWRLRWSGLTQTKIANQVGVSQQLVSLILREECWVQFKPKPRKLREINCNGEPYCVSDCEEQRPG